MITTEDFTKLIEKASRNRLIISASREDSYRRIQQTCPNDVNKIRNHALFLKKESIFKHICYNHPITPLIKYIDFLIEATRRIIPDLDFNEIPEFIDWGEIVNAIHSARNDSVYFLDEHKNISFHKKEVMFAESCSRLIKLGVEFETINNDIYIHSNSFNFINNEILHLCREIGGETIIRLMLDEIKILFDSTMSRYHITRQVARSNEDIPLAIPWGYLMLVGLSNLKSLKKNNDKAYQKIVYDKLKRILTDLVSTYEIQPYSIYENIYLNDQYLVKFLQECILYDNLIPLQQWNPQHAKNIITFLTKQFIDNNEKSYCLSLKTIVKIGISLIKESNKSSIKKITAKEIAEKTKIPITKVSEVLNKIFIFKNEKLEKGVIFPPGKNSIGFYSKPLYQSNDGLFLLPSSLCSFSVSNAVLYQISYPSGIYNNNQDSKLGCQVEKLLINAFESKGIKTTYGNYFFHKKLNVGESDLIVETHSTIFIFEVKKKSMTNAALFGQDFEILTSLAASVLHSQSQAFKIEYLLHLNGEINIKNKNGINKVSLNNRVVKKISVSLNDFGSLQDLITLQTILSSSISSIISSSDKDVDGKLNDWRNFIKDINNYLILMEDPKQPQRLPFYNSLFMSVSQILTILGACNNETDFLSEISRGSNLILSKRDFYQEYSMKKNLLKDHEHKNSLRNLKG
ncbi:hypothetical protein [Rahnella sp. PD4]|uniref:hypothetical protein n=1 Tax=Rahnella sp. PD4 TaxID=3368611 RepID=UPI003BA0BAC9